MLRSFTTPGRTQWGWLASEPFLLTVCLEPHNGASLPTIAAWQTELLADAECEGCVRSCQTTFFQTVANRTGTENSLVCCFFYFIVVARQKSLTAFQYSVMLSKGFSVCKKNSQNHKRMSEIYNNHFFYQYIILEVFGQKNSGSVLYSWDEARERWRGLERDEEEVDASFKEGGGRTSLALTTSCLSLHHTAHRKLSARNTHLLSVCQEFTSDTYRSSIRGYTTVQGGDQSAAALSLWKQIFDNLK